MPSSMLRSLGPPPWPIWDRLDEARRWADKAIARLARTPGGALAIAGDRVVGLLLDNNPYCREEDRDHFAEGMRKAGIPG